MNEENLEETFYNKVGELLKTEHIYQKFPYHHRTRWNNRSVGNGRYIGHGIVRYYSSTMIHVQLHTPKVTGLFMSAEAAMETITKAIRSA